MDTDYIFIAPDVFKCGDILPENCKKEKIDLGAVPDEKFAVFGTVYDLFPGLSDGGDSPEPVPPVPPTPVVPTNEIWYTTTDGEIYPLEQIIVGIRQQGITYNGPEVLSNIWDNDKNMFVMTFDRDVDLLGDINEGCTVIGGPFFINKYDVQIICKINKIIIPNSIYKIGALAFFECVSLTSIDIPNNVEQIDYASFYNCNNLISVVIPNSVTSLDRTAFYMGEHDLDYHYPIEKFIVNGITYQTNNANSLEVVLSNGSNVNLLLWDLIELDTTVTVVDAGGQGTTVKLDKYFTYAEQGFDGYYSQDTYNSETETPEQFSVSDNHPEEGDIIYDACTDIHEGVV